MEKAKKLNVGPFYEVSDWSTTPGNGLQCVIENKHFKIGNEKWMKSPVPKEMQYLIRSFEESGKTVYFNIFIFYLILFNFILFYFILFYFILFYFILFYFILFLFIYFSLIIFFYFNQKKKKKGSLRFC